MREHNVEITNEFGIHARPAAALVREAMKYQSSVEFEKDGQVVDGKSIMGLLILAAECGSTLLIRADGADEEHAIQGLCTLLQDEDRLEGRKSDPTTTEGAAV